MRRRGSRILAALQIRGPHFRPLQEFAPGTGQRNDPVDHDVSAVRELRITIAYARTERAKRLPMRVAR